MWNSSTSGGFNTSITSPGGPAGHEKGKRRQNIVPLSVGEVLAAPEDGFMVEGMEVGMVVLVEGY